MASYLIEFLYLALMKMEFWVIGKTAERYLKDGCAIYEKRLKHYVKFETKEIPLSKNQKLPSNLLKIDEGKTILKLLKPDDFLILLDEKGKEYSSVAFSNFIQKLLNKGQKRVIFLVGGAFGFSNEIYDRAQAKLSLSQMTFSHQMIRLFFLEQVYRAMTILKNEKYHNE